MSDKDVIYYDYYCPVCKCMCRVGFFGKPYANETFTCNADGTEHDLLIVSVDNDAMTIIVDDMNRVLYDSYADYFTSRDRDVPDDFEICSIDR